jgi:hypothetical protein
MTLLYQYLNEMQVQEPTGMAVILYFSNKEIAHASALSCVPHLEYPMRLW